MFKGRFCNVHVPNMSRVSTLMQKSINANHMSNFGPLYNEFAEYLHRFLGLPEDKEVIIVSSGHTALMAAYSVLEAKACVLPAFTFASTLQAAKINNVKTSILDVDMETAALTTKILETKVGKYDTVVLVTPLSLIPDLKGIEEWCHANNKKLIIDGAASFGTEGVYQYGDAYCLSFHATKSFPLGEGGAIVISKDLAPKVRSYINFGLDSNRDIIGPGINAKVSEYTCAVGIALLEEMNKDISLRCLNAMRFEDYLNPDYIKQSWTGISGTVFQSFPIFVPHAEKTRQRLLDAGYEVKQYYKPFTGKRNASELYNMNICLPCNPTITDEQVKEMSEIVNAL